MIGIPLISHYIHRVVKPQVVADSVDYLNYYCTSLLLAFFALAISAKQYFGSPIQCFVPNEFKGKVSCEFFKAKSTNKDVFEDDMFVVI